MTIFKDFQTLKTGQPLVIYELNEVPWRVFDWYVKLKPKSNFAHLLGTAKTFTTVTRDEGELHPWTTWPTFHRGVTNSTHNIRFINQNLADSTNFPPVWETLEKSGKRVGVFGSLQSYPPPSGNNYEFFIPDTFSPGFETIPAKYQAFQRFNLRQTKQDGAQASNIQLNKNIFSDVVTMLQAGLSLGTCITLATHLAKEKLNPLNRARRSVLQAIVAFDFFQDALKNTHPDFCTFFSNHVAGMMHRYWKQSFPEDFNTALASDKDVFNAGNIAFAMDIADTQVGSLMSYVKARQGLLMIASSMGQEAIVRGEYSGEWRIADVPKFLQAIDWQAPVLDLMAMQPDFNFEFNSTEDADLFLSTIQKLVDADGKSIFSYRAKRINTTVSLGLSPSPQALSSGKAYFQKNDASRIELDIEQMGIKFLKRDPGTGYHQPYGTLLMYGDGFSPSDSRAEVDTTSIRPAILSLLGVNGNL